MNIKKEGDNLIVTIPLKQKISNPYMDDKDLYDTDALIGIIAGNDFTISHLIDLNYKDSQQEGMPILYFDTREELEDVCKEFGIQVWEHDTCFMCKKVIYGSSAWTSNGSICFDCEFKKDEDEKIKTGWDKKICANGHTMIGIGFNDGCPECEAPWVV